MGLQHTDHFAQHQAGQWDKLHACLPQSGLLSQSFLIGLGDEFHRLAHVLPRHAILVQNGQRVTSPEHVDACDGAPRTADKEKAILLRPHPLGESGHFGLDDFVDRLLATAHRLQALRAELRRYLLADPAVLEFRQFHGRPADIADQPVGPRPPEQHALCGKTCLFLAIDHPKLQPGFAFDLGPELGPVIGLPDRSGGYGGQRADAHAVGQRLKPAKGPKGTYPSVRVQAPRLRKTRAEAAHHFLVVEIGR